MADDYAANTTTTGQLTVGAAPISAAIDAPNDHDWFRVQLAAGTYRLTMNPGATLLNAAVVLRDSGGTQVGSTGLGSFDGDATVDVTVPAGTYFVDAGVNGGDTGAYQLSITSTGAAPQPDLDAHTLSLSSTNVTTGGTTTATYTLANIGSAAAAASSVGFYRSTDTVFDGSDVLFATQDWTPISAGESGTANATLQLSVSGSFYIFAVADYPHAIAESDETNNPTNPIFVTVSPPAAPVLAITALSANKPEGSGGGTTPFTFTVTRSGNTSGTSTVAWQAVTGQSPTVDQADFSGALDGTLTFAANETTKTITINVVADGIVESSENFAVSLSSPTGATISASQGSAAALIQNDDNPSGSITINDVTITEGNAGSTLATFTATRTGGTAAFAVNYATADGTATVADGDYVAKSGTLSFATGVNTQTVSVTINGDTKFEGNETFALNLSGATNGATISDGQGVGTITNDDAAVAGSVSIGDVTVTEGNTGTTLATFTATRTGGTAAFSVNYATADGTATVADGDYVGKSGTLSFAAGVNTQTVSVTINGDMKVETTEYFGLNLSGATNAATISDGQSVGTITNDDVNRPPVITSDGGGDAATLLIPENSTRVTTVTAFDPDSDALTFAISGGADATRFQLDATTHVLSFVAAPDFEAPTDSDHNNSYIVQVRVTDSGGLSDTQTIVANVKDLQFLSPAFKLNNFGFSDAGGGWKSDNQYPRELGDVDGDGMADIVGFGDGGVLVSLATGGGNFAAPFFALNNFGFSNAGGGWTSDNRYPRHVADVNGDHLADIVGFGEGGVLVSLATGGGHFGPATFALNNFGFSNAGGGWKSNDQYPRELGDVDGDGMADIVGFGDGGVLVSLATGGGNFAAPFFSLNNFGFSTAGGGWTSDDKYPRHLADVNGDHRADIVGFGEGGALVSLATSGGHFAAPSFALNNFGFSTAGGGWKSADQYPRELGDVDHDGLADIVGFGDGGVLVSHATGGGHFGAPTFALDDFGFSQTGGGWTSNDDFPRHVADVNGDGAADLVGFGYAGVLVALATDFHI